MSDSFEEAADDAADDADFAPEPSPYRGMSC